MIRDLIELCREFAAAIKELRAFLAENPEAKACAIKHFCREACKREES